MQILVVAIRVEVPAGVRKAKSSRIEMRNLTLTHGLRDGCQRPGLRGRTSTVLSRALADGAMDARGRVYEGGPQPLWAAR